MRKGEFANEADRILRKYVPVTVREWASYMGCSYGYFRHRYQQITSIPAGEKLRDVRWLKIKEFLRGRPGAKAYETAMEFGFPNEKALGKFLKRNYSITYPQLRKLIADGTDQT